MRLTATHVAHTCMCECELLRHVAISGRNISTFGKKPLTPEQGSWRSKSGNSNVAWALCPTPTVCLAETRMEVATLPPSHLSWPHLVHKATYSHKTFSSSLFIICFNRVRSA